MKKGFFFVPLLFVAAGVTAQTDDSATQGFLIEKLQRVYTNLAPNDSSKVPVTLRLADLLAERARIASMKELESGCTVCDAGLADREKAVRLYQEALPHAPESGKGRVLVQIGHLYELLGNEKEALQFYQETSKSAQQVSAVAEANLSLAEIHFKRNRFAEAKKYYSLVLNEKAAGSRGLAAYRLAWCELNLGGLNAGIEGFKTILKTPELQSKNGGVQAQADHQFMEEVSRDLATWISRTESASAQVEELYKLSPESSRQSNLMTLALELERTGKKAEAAKVWATVQSRASQPEVRLEAQVRLVYLVFDEKNTDPSLKNLETAVAQWQDLKGCGKPDCTELRKLLRGFVTNWNQTEKKAPSESLLHAYEVYLRQFTDDGEMVLWGAQVAKERKQWAIAARMMESAAQAFIAEKNQSKLESVLLTNLENAELSKEPALWERAAQVYLEKSQQKTKFYEVRYQQVHHIYDAGDYAKAKAGLLELVGANEAPRALRVQAAHLTLDTMALLRQDAEISTEANRFATLFAGAEAKDFKEIQQKALMNRVAVLASADAEGAWTQLSQIDINQAKPEDRKVYLKNKIILAEKTKRFDLAGASVDDYLSLKDLTAEEKEFALAKKAWLAELRLDFATALKSTQALATSLQPDQKALKLALYADLSGGESRGFYQQFLTISKDDEAKSAIALQMIRTAKDPLVELEKHSTILSKNPEQLARIYVEIYAKNQDEKVLKKARADKRIEKTNWGMSLARIELLKELSPIAEKLKVMKLDSKNQKSLAVTIKSRAAELDRLEKSVAKAIQNGDWTSQLVSLDVLAKESERFYQEILSLPMPQGLTADEESQYLNLLGQQASPYQNRAATAKAKVEEFWKTAGWKDSLQKSLNDSGEMSVLVKNEITALKMAAQGPQLEQLNQIQNPSFTEGRPTRESLEAARGDLRQNPFDRNRIEQLLTLEKQNKNFAMIQYLEERLRESTAKEKSL